MSLVSSIGNILIGAVQQLGNELTGRVVLPIPGLPKAPVGDIFEILGNDAQRGADLVERALESLRGAARTSQDSMRTARPLLANAQVRVGQPGAITRIHFTATAQGADWGAAGRESARIAVYVDGRYHSSVPIVAERGGSYAVDLGALPAGTHSVELRDAKDATSQHVPIVLQAAALRSEQLTGEDALVARHAPVLELRDVDPGASASTARSDAPMLLVPAVTRHPDGTTTIAYRVAFSNEEGGTPTPNLLAQYGRSADLEPIYTVRVRADGSVIDSWYQSAIHSWRRFEGVRQGDRPVLRVSTANSMVSMRVRAAGDGAERWSEAPIAAVDRSTSDFAVMASHPWTWTVMAKEALREGKADLRRFVFVGPLTDAQRGAVLARGGIELVLADGRRVLAPLPPKFAAGPWHQGAIELPPNALADAVVGVSLTGVRVGVLDASMQLRELAPAA